MKNLLLTGGMYHDFPTSAATLAAVLAEVGIQSQVQADMHAGLDALSHESFDLVTVYALRWTMPQDKFAQQRATWAFSPTAAQRNAMASHVAAGKGLLVLHTGAICFDDWPEWRELVGAGWTWGHSNHPPHGPVSVRITPRVHPITEGVPAFEFDDEAYTAMDLVPGLEPLAEVRASVQTAWSPCLWVRDLQPGRVVFDALGHDSASLDHTWHRRIVQRSALWALDRSTTTAPRGAPEQA